MKFREDEIGAPFTFRGKAFAKTALSAGSDASQRVNAFQYEADVQPAGKNSDPANGFP